MQAEQLTVLYQVASRHAPLPTQSSVAARTRLTQMRSRNTTWQSSNSRCRESLSTASHKVCIQVFRFPPHNGLDVTVTFITEVIILITRYRGHRTDILSCDRSCDRNRIISTFYSQHTDINEPTATPGMSHVISVTHRQQPEVYGSILVVSCHRLFCIFIFPVTILKKLTWSEPLTSLFMSLNKNVLNPHSQLLVKSR